jgi:hypothetical protein
MKKTALSAVALLLASGAAWAASGLEFIGEINIQSASAACTRASEVGVNDIYRFRYNPPGLGGSYAGTRFTLFDEGGAQNYDYPSGSLVGTTFQTVKGAGIYRSAYTWTTSKMRFTKQTPATLALTTKTVILTGDIQNFDDVAGCTVHFTGAGAFHT